MKNKILIFGILIISNFIIAQNTKNLKNNPELLKKFWKKLSLNTESNNKKEIAELFNFPFYCSLCIDEDDEKNKSTVRVTKKLFFQRSFKLNFLIKINSEVKSDPKFNIEKFHNAEDENAQIISDEYFFVYTITKPSKNWEGLQGIIHLKKIKNDYKIVGIDSVP